MTLLSKAKLYLTCSATAIACGAMILSPVAQASPFTGQRLAQNTASPKSAPASTSAPAGQTAPATGPSLNLSADQKQKIQAIMQGSANQIMAVLTPEQKTKLKQAADTKQSPQAVTAALNLTTDQKSKIQSIQVEEEKKIKAVLTPDQIKILQNRTAPK
jgi:Spy/CpxP family protein refolding chaperone